MELGLEGCWFEPKMTGGSGGLGWVWKAGFTWLFFPSLALDKTAPEWPEQLSSKRIRREAGNAGEAPLRAII